MVSFMKATEHVVWECPTRVLAEETYKAIRRLYPDATVDLDGNTLSVYGNKYVCEFVKFMSDRSS